MQPPVFKICGFLPEVFLTKEEDLSEKKIPVIHVFRNLFQEMPHIIKGPQIIGFCSFHYAVNDCGSPGTIDCINHLPIFLPNTKTSDRSFGRIIIDWNISVCEKYTEIFFLIQRITEPLAVA